ncbi:hypothetical protein E2C01_034748 [Portunus trituberculatus]|uniref:Uncharacterized protein n=1 Tax=Portunus trituberculatus TaxID=210409 RepID=A0A5B7F9K4_PORTR|nr:hypothetical protein [Portunus trituberculatus]
MPQCHPRHNWIRTCNKATATVPVTSNVIAPSLAVIVSKTNHIKDINTSGYRIQDKNYQVLDFLT